ncbi:MAG: HTTM domain-containing protein [Alphaproteobacteria bacterium]|nr:HTTM domain-containing protein [Alphaproteobacteria bacterium]
MADAPSRTAWDRLWFGRDEGGRGAVVRLGFFLLLALDSWEQVEHAARYGAGHFNVSHFPALDGLLMVPQASWVLVLFLMQAFLAFQIAFGVAVRSSLTLLTLAFGYTYFTSQLNSYQHHYLVFMLLLICTGAVWLERSSGREALPSWSLQLMRAQLSVMYGWAAVAKLDGLWISGETLSLQITPAWAKEWIASAGQALGVETLSVYAAMSVVVIAVELLLAVGWMTPRMWWLICLIGVPFHLSIELLEFKIGRFSFFMVMLYALVLPDGLIAALDRLRDRVSAAWPRVLDDRPHMATRVIGAALVVVMLWLLPFAESRWFALLAGASVLLSGGGRLSLGLRVVAAGSLLVASGTGETARDYYRYMGGDARRRGEVETGIFAYTQVTRIDPAYHSGWVRLGDLHRRDGDDAEAIRCYERARALEPNDVTTLRRLVEVLTDTGQQDLAQEHARALLRVSPDDPVARRALGQR